MLGENYNCIVVLGPTASGKTRLACHLAALLDGEIISLDSRQVYKDLNIGTGKDLGEYVVKGKEIPYHLIGMKEVNHKFYLHELVSELKIAFDEIRSRNKLPILCGGTGLYLDALRKDFSYTQAPEDLKFRSQAEQLNKIELEQMLQQFPLEYIQHIYKHSKKRLIRGIEVARFLSQHPVFVKDPANTYKPFYIGIHSEKAILHQRIEERLILRIKDGLIEETEGLLKKGITSARLKELGLEYKFSSLYLAGELNKEEYFEKLHTAIKQFAKRQKTWFRKMEKEGVKINWVDSALEAEQILGSLPELNALKRH